MKDLPRLGLLMAGVLLAWIPLSAAEKLPRPRVYPDIQPVNTSDASEAVRAVPNDRIITAAAQLAQLPAPDLAAAVEAAKQLLTTFVPGKFEKADLRQLTVLILERSIKNADADIRQIQAGTKKQQTKKKNSAKQNGGVEVPIELTIDQKRRVQMVLDRKVRIEQALAEATQKPDGSSAGTAKKTN